MLILKSIVPFLFLINTPSDRASRSLISPGDQVSWSHPLSAGNAAHDFKMSVCEITYSIEKEAFDVKFYLFQDDLKSTLYGNPDAPVIDENKAVDYILKHFNLRVNGQQQPLTFQFMRGKNDQVLMQFSTPKIPLTGISNMQVKNNLLLEKFREQINMVYAVLPGRDKLTQMLNATRTEVLFSI